MVVLSAKAEGNWTALRFPEDVSSLIREASSVLNTGLGVPGI